MRIQVVSYSELDTFRQCPLKHKLSYVGRWTKPKEGGALFRGSLWHAVLEIHYTALMVAQQRNEGRRLGVQQADATLTFAQGEILKLLKDPTSGEFASEDAELVWWMYEGYVAYYGADPGWRIKAVEYKTTVPLLTEEGKRSRFRLKVKMDLVVQDLLTGHTEIIDHKSAADFTRPAELDIDDQFGLYTWAARQEGAKVFCSQRSDARTRRNKGPMRLEDRFQRLPSYRPDQELTALALDAYRAAKAAYGAANKIPYSSPNPSQCSWKCDFLQVHLAARKGIPIETALRDFGFVQDFTRH